MNGFDLGEALKVALVCCIAGYCFGPVGVAAVGLALLLKAKK